MDESVGVRAATILSPLEGSLAAKHQVDESEGDISYLNRSTDPFGYLI